MDYADLTHITGPAIVTFNSQTWYSEGDIGVNIAQETFDVRTSRYGIIDKRIGSLPVGTLSFKPDGQLTTARMAKAFPYTLADVGKSIFTAADVPLTVQTLAGQLYTFARAGISQLPGLLLSAQTTAFDGTLQFNMLSARGEDPAAADSFLTIASNAFADTSYDLTKVLTPGYTAAYGATPYDVMEALNGFRVSLGLTTSMKKVDRFGVIDIILTGMGPASCRFTPAGMAEADYLALSQVDDGLKLPGSSVGAGTTDLVITGTGCVVTLAKAGVHTSGYKFGTEADRLGELTFWNRPTFAIGVPAAPITITV